MEFSKNRALGYIIITLVYALAIVTGVFVYLALPFDFWLSLLIADVAATVVTFIFSVVFKNASVYDPYWSVQPIVILAAFSIGKDINAAMLLPLIAVGVWGVRLTANWAYTFYGFGYQDWRYTMLKEQTGVFYPLINFLGIHLVPTLIVYGCTLPAVFTLVYAPTANIGSVIFFLVSLMATVLQGISDIQMHTFRKSGKGGFIRNGLWKYSRHPNYLGEILMWWGVGLAAVCAMPDKWWLIAGALANTFLFLFVSIPMADKRQSRKNGFVEYKKATHMLLPIKK